MAEDLTVEDVETYTGGRLAADDPDTERALKAALSRCRRYCNWHVTPVRTDTITLDGTGRVLLPLPTLKVVEIVSVFEDGAPVDATVSGIMLAKSSGCWKPGHGNIEVEFSHGYTADEAMDFRDAVLSLIDRETLNVGTGGDGPVISKRVDDVELKWGESQFCDALDPYYRWPWYVA